MNDTTISSVPALVIRRTYDVPPARVFEAWTNPETASIFLGPGDVKATDVQMDVRPGGAYAITMLMPEGERMIARGIYRDVRPPERLQMTWRWDEDDPADEHESLLTLEFHDRGGKTEFVLTHEQLASVESRGRHEEGWNAIADQLEATLAGRPR
jgi:uncharacterized protein YndB with AHSA1/START domain